ncbi:hypothetical protein ES703_44095 [subsurface metagenome]
MPAKSAFTCAIVLLFEGALPLNETVLSGISNQASSLSSSGSSISTASIPYAVPKGCPAGTYWPRSTLSLTIRTSMGKDSPVRSRFSSAVARLAWAESSLASA